MEELQDAIEDAQYVNAIATQEEGPRPVLPWEKPTEEQLLEWEESKGGGPDSDLGTMDWTLSAPIGLFLFSSFVKERHDDYVRMNFCEEILRFKKLHGRARYEKALTIIQQFLAPIEEVRGKAKALAVVEQPNGGEKEAIVEAMLPARTVIDEYDLERADPKQQTTREEVDKLLAVNMDYPVCSATVVGLKGPVWKDLVTKFRQIKDQQKTTGPRSLRDVRGALTSSGSAPLPSSTGTPTNAGRSTMPPGPEMSASMKAAIAAADEEKTSKPSASTGNDDDGAAPSEEGDPGGASTTNKTNSGGVGPNDNRSEPASEDVSSAQSTPTPAEPPQSLEQQRQQQESHPPPPPRELQKSQSTEDEPPTPVPGSPQRWLRSPVLPSAVPATVFDQAERVVVESLRRQYWQPFLESEEYWKFKNFMWYQDRRVVPEDFFVMRVLGRGGFGLVTACKKGTSGKLYAMKVMNKRRIKIKKSEPLALNERQALAAVESNFVVNLKYSFHSKDDVFLILDLMTGGDLGYHLHQKGRFPKKECQYYAARIMLGLQALHDKGYVYRDLKPENCLLADDGRVRITDLGLATKITPTLHGAAGTRGYWAPEMLRRDKKGKRLPYGHTVDWFSFGCCVAEFISGSNPFRSEAALNFGLERGKQTKEKAIDCATMEMEPDLKPEKFEPDAADLCRRLLDKDEKTRLGFGGCEEIMAHPWFKNVNWEAIISDRKRPPFIPPKDVNAASQSEIGTFAEDKAYQETVVTESDDEVYKDWDWTNPHAFAAEVIEFLIYERETGEPLLPINQHGSCCCVIL